jgi:hypothetical protein
MKEIEPLARVYIHLREEDYELLRELAGEEYRSPKEHASYLLGQYLREIRQKREMSKPRNQP